jgi:hypothetical protein
MTKKFKMPEPDGMDVGVYYWPETVKQALRDVLEQAAQACLTEPTVMIHKWQAAEIIRAMIGEIK